MSDLYYVFDTEQGALDAENYIRLVGELPRTGINAATGLPDETAQKTECWAIPQQRLDGKWVFQRLPLSVLATVPQAVRDYFVATFPHVLEEYSSTWFSAPEEL